MNFKTIENKYRPIPFWSWNDKLDTDETVNQVKLMHEAGIGGFFMHARGGLTTEYMGEEWFDNVSAAVETAEKNGMFPWAYDENGWPSGFGGGIINGKGEKYQQKYLRMEKGEKQTPYTIANADGYHFYYEINQYYVDTLDDEVTKEFIEEIYEPYYKKFGNRIQGFFTDEPQISRNGIPWSLKIPAEYQKAYNEDLLPCLRELFCDTGDFKNTRIKFWKLVTEMFSKNYMKQIYDWCTAHGLALTGHLLMEETLENQLITNGAVMPHYEYFTIPGLDWLGVKVYDCLTQRQLASVAEQLGKKQVLGEIYACCGHNIGFEDLRRIYEAQAVRGVNLLCQHLEGYSLKGLRKRDCPTTISYQQPWWSEFGTFIDAMSRVGKILAEGNAKSKVLLIHPQTTAWSLYDDGENKGLRELDERFLEYTKRLESKHILFHLGDEIIIERHGRVEGNKFIIGEQAYDRVILMPDTILFENTRKLLEEFAANGGIISEDWEIEANDITDNENLIYTKREFDGFDVHYFVNTTKEEQKAVISRGGRYMDILTGELHPFDGWYAFAPFESLIVIDDGTPQSKREDKKESSVLSLEGEWIIKERDLNVLTLDKCSYYFDGELQEKDGFTINILGRACDLKRPVKIRMEYNVFAEFVPEELYLVTETPELFKILINGQKIKKTDCGYFADKTFRKLSVGEYFKQGLNSIVLEVDFALPEKNYEDVEKSKFCESELNKLTYDMEIESIYLVGNFDVSAGAVVSKLEKNIVRVSDDFKIIKPSNTVTLKNIEQQGFAFFAGKLVLEKRIEIEDTNKKIVFNKKGINIIKVAVNGKEAGMVLWNPSELDLSELLTKGENVITITVVNNLRNMLGPHHCEEEPDLVWPNHFYKEGRISREELNAAWNDGYTLAETSLI